MSTSMVPQYPAEHSNGYGGVRSIDCMIMEGSTTTRLKVKQLDGYACPNNAIFAYVDVLPGHNIQAHQYTLGRFLPNDLNTQ